MEASEDSQKTGMLEIEPDAVDAAFRAAAGQYVLTRRTRIDYFTRRHFSLAGAIRLHRAALGADLVRAPVNLALALPHIVKLVSAAILRKTGRKRGADLLLRLPTQLETAVARQVN